VFIGQSKSSQRSGLHFDTTTFGTEEFRIRAIGKQIAIAGGSPRGTLYGVYHFAEHYLGVRFLTLEHTHIPHEPQGVIPEIDLRYEPPFSFRWSFWTELNNHPAFAARQRNNCTTFDAKYGGITAQPLISHSLARHVPVDVYGEAHPEYFALVDGERSLEAYDGAQINSTHPAVIDVVTQSVLSEFAATSPPAVVSVSPNDNNRYSTDPRNALIDRREGTPMGSHLTLVNAVADAVGQRHPQANVGTLAYWHTRKPPMTLQPRSNVHIQLCSFAATGLYAINDPRAPVNAAFCADLERWIDLTPKVWVWHYVTNLRHVDLPYANWRGLDDTIRYYRDQGVRGLFMQGNGRCYGGEFADLKNYVVSRLMWNPDEDGDALIEEFLTLHYGPAAPPIRAMMDALTERARAGERQPRSWSTAQENNFDEATARMMIARIDEALTLAPDEAIRRRVEKLSIGAYKALIETAGAMTYADGRAWVEAPPNFADDVARYHKLCFEYGMNRDSEFSPLAGYLDEVASSQNGADATRIEDDTWRLTAVPAIEGAIAELYYKPAQRQLLSAYGSPGPRLGPGAFRVDFIHGGDDSQDFIAEEGPTSLTLAKPLHESTEFTHVVGLTPGLSDVVEGTLRIAHKGEEEERYQLRLRPRFSMGAGRISLYVYKGAWRRVSRDAWSAALAEPSVTAAGFFNIDEAFGAAITAEAGQFSAFAAPPTAAPNHFPADLVTRSVTLAPGGAFEAHYAIEVWAAPPQSP
jgi:hypothetical protein